MSISPDEERVVAVAAPRRDALGNACFVLHLGVMIYIVFGSLAPWHAALLFYVAFLPVVAIQWQFNKNSCVLNNVESVIRTGRWRDPGNEEEGAWLLTLARDTLGIRATPAQMDAFIYSIVAGLWGLGLAHLFGVFGWHSTP